MSLFLDPAVNVNGFVETSCETLLDFIVNDTTINAYVNSSGLGIKCSKGNDRYGIQFCSKRASKEAILAYVGPWCVSHLPGNKSITERAALTLAYGVRLGGLNPCVATTNPMAASIIQGSILRRHFVTAC